MRKHWYSYLLVLSLGATFSACDESFEDVVPATFKDITMRDDEIYIINGGSAYGTRLDPLLNDSIKVEATISYSTPSHGTITFIENEGWFYKPVAEYTGEDNVTYTLCSNGKCASASIKIYVEPPYDPNNCQFEINGETVETTMNTPIEIRIYVNDVVCPYMGGSVSSPEKGKFATYSYSGSFKNTVIIYYPPKGFTGTDRFKYKLFTNGPDLEAYCTIIVK